MENEDGLRAEVLDDCWVVRDTQTNSVWWPNQDVNEDAEDGAERVLRLVRHTPMEGSWRD